MRVRDRSRPAVYELTIVGSVGPVLRDVLRPHSVATAEVHTIVCAALPGDRDLVDLVEMLAARGLEITEVTVMGE
jgi:hypothetical protein